ncbi:MAG: choice-of-anchor J domain-containing protein [Janthinobacterium lividum]
MMKKALVALAMSGMMASAHAGYLVKEEFTDVAGLASKGWVLNNASTPGGATEGWYQGDQTQFNAFSGPRNSYAAANYNNAPEGGILENWLITPEFSSDLAAKVTFRVRGAFAEGFSDQIAFGFSDGSSDLGAFLLGAVYTVNTDGWTMVQAKLAKGFGSARFAIQYTGDADSANYIGVDNLRVMEVPEPSTMLILGAGVMGLAAARRRRQR